MRAIVATGAGPEGRLRRLLEIPDTGVASLDGAGFVRFLNGTGAALLGCDAAGAIGRSFAELLPPPIGTLFQEALEGRESARFAARADGGRWLSVQTSRHEDGFAVWFRDETEGRLAAEAAAARVAAYHAMAEASHLAVCYLDPRGGPVRGSAALFEWLGRAPGQIRADDWVSLVHPEDRDRVAGEWAALLSQPRQWRTECRLRRGDGIYRRVELRFGPVFGPRGELQEIVCTCDDVEQRYRTEMERRELLRALDRRSERLASVLEGLPVGVLLAEAPSGRTLQVNDAFLSPTGGSTSLPGGRDGEDPILRVVRDGVAIEGEEIRLAGGDGSDRWLRLNALPLRDGSGALVAGLATVVEITDHKRLEAALRESEASFRFCLESISQHVWIADPKGEILYFNRRFFEYLGRRFDEAALPARPWADAIHPDDRERCLRIWRDALAAGRAFEFEARLRRHDGAERWFLARGVPMRDEAGRVVRWFGTCTDVDDLRRTSQALAASEARFARLATLDMFGLFSWQVDGRILWANREFLRVTGYDEDDLREGRIRWDALLSPEDLRHDRGFVESLLRTGAMRPVERIWLRKDGGKVPVVVTAALDGPESRTGTAFVFDATERKQLEEFQRQLIGMVGHDLRNPLAAMLATTGVLLRKELDPGIRRAIERIHFSAQRMRRITADLVDYTQARVGAGLPIAPAEVDVSQLCHAVVAEARLLAPDRAILAEGEGNLQAVWDRARIEQALSNLLGNAIKYGDGAIAVRWSREGEEVAIQVENEGASIDPALLPRLFHPFRPGNAEGAGGKQSLGLGLFIVAEIARCHGGRTAIEPTPGGTRVELRLPIAVRAP